MGIPCKQLDVYPPRATSHSPGLVKGAQANHYIIFTYK